MLLMRRLVNDMYFFPFFFSQFSTLSIQNNSLRMWRELRIFLKDLKSWILMFAVVIRFVFHIAVLCKWIKCLQFFKSKTRLTGPTGSSCYCMHMQYANKIGEPSIYSFWALSFTSSHPCLMYINCECCFWCWQVSCNWMTGTHTLWQNKNDLRYFQMVHCDFHSGVLMWTS